ncbi:MAG: glycosyltransferase family 39 protein [Gemmatimonadetes bacterium]|nr:glycosyltransferase family 39 protein [Gemmatimonadota bacterium]
MDSTAEPSPGLARWSAPLGLILLAALAMGNVLPNTFTRDDLGIVVGGTLETHWSGIIHAFGAAYWPPANSGELYRPLTIAWMTVQWQLGGGAPLLFRIVTVALYAVATLSVWALLRRLVHPTAAWMGAAIFAVHPVHVEAVVEAVSQSELIVAALLCWAVALHVDANAGRREVRWASGRESLLFAIAIYFKENALVLPALLLAADALVDREAGGFAARWARWKAHYGAMVVIAALFWVTRSIVLGAQVGTHTAEWLRLFVWPAHLQDEWSMLEWIPTKGWSLRELAGLLALGSVTLAAVLAWRPRPHLTFGIVFIAIALGPVANLVIPTGVVIAERTLFLPSVGFVIAIAVLAGELFRPGRSFAPIWRRAGLVGFALLLGLGILRSTLRMVDWRTPVIYPSGLRFAAGRGRRHRRGAT